MESQSSHNSYVAAYTVKKLIETCDMIVYWNKKVNSADDYLHTPEGMEKMAATCMMIESIGEGVKKLDKFLPGFLAEYAPEVPWRSIKGLRDHIAHGYFNLDSEVIFDVARNEIPDLKMIFDRLLKLI